jgi:hypothetical protein
MLDTRRNLTVFLVTVGASSYPVARRALQQQTCALNIVEISGVTPMSAAFQAMLDQCKTRYFIQVDEDMVLKAGAVSAMYKAMLSMAGSPTAMLCYSLWDKHLGMPRLGVKIYDHQIFSRYPYQDVHSCEVDQLDRLKRDGYSIQCFIQPVQGSESATVMGYHGTQYTAREAFLTYRDMMWKAKHVPGNEWFTPWCRRFLMRVLERGDNSGRSDPDLWAFLGCVAALLSKPPDGEKDAKSYEADPQWQALAKAIGISHQVGADR